MGAGSQIRFQKNIEKLRVTFTALDPWPVRIEVSRELLNRRGPSPMHLVGKTLTIRCENGEAEYTEHRSDGDTWRGVRLGAIGRNPCIH